MSKMVYLFEEGNADMRNLLGGKGANRCRNDKSGASDPTGFHGYNRGLYKNYYNKWPYNFQQDIQQQIFTALVVIWKRSRAKIR